MPADSRDFPLDPKAIAIARVAGLSRSAAADIVSEAQAEMSDLLIGGYHIDAVILALYVALDAEEQTHSEVMERIVDAVREAWDGLV